MIIFAVATESALSASSKVMKPKFLTFFAMLHEKTFLGRQSSILTTIALGVTSLSILQEPKT